MSVNDFDDEGQSERSGEGSGFLSHLPVILWERRWLIFIPLLIGLIGSLLAYFLIPSVFRSTAVMVVQSAQLPTDVTGNLRNEVIDRRIARIRQQVTSRPDLVSLIDRHGLYKGDRNSTPLSKIIENMRDDILISPSMADVPPDQMNQRTIAFTLSFDYDQAGPSQAVTQELMEKILEIDQTDLTGQRANTVQFLTEQSKGLEAQISELQGQISAVTARNGGLLRSGGSAAIFNNTASYDMQISQLQRDNSTMLAQRNQAATSDSRDPAVVSAEGQLAAMRSVYSETHPDVVIAKQRLAEARELAKSNITKIPLQTIDQQIAFNNAQIASLRAAKSQEQASIRNSVSSQSQAPLVERQIADLQQRLTGLNQQYESVSTKLMTAKAGMQADDQQMGERLAVVDPPVVPDAPVWPKTWLLFTLGIGGGLALGILLAMAVELLSGPIRDPLRLSAILGASPLGVIPMIERRGSMIRERKWWMFWKRNAA